MNSPGNRSSAPCWHTIHNSPAFVSCAHVKCAEPYWRMKGPVLTSQMVQQEHDATDPTKKATTAIELFPHHGASEAEQMAGAHRRMLSISTCTVSEVTSRADEAVWAGASAGGGAGRFF